MISIRQCVSEEKIQELKRLHNTFVFKEIEKRINFYIHLFQLLKEINGKKISAKEIEIKIKSPGILHYKQYESYINLIFKSPYQFSEKKYNKLKYDDRLKVKIKDFDIIIKLLKELKSTKDFEYNLLQLDLTKRKLSYNYYYQQLVKRYKPIGFLQNKLFDYNWFVSLTPDKDWSAYKLTLGLDINVCCYCNKQYIFSLTSGSQKITRPQLDHFLSQKKNPLLSLNFFNLIPCCKVCNSDCKHDQDFSHKENLSPYEDISSSQLFAYNYKPNSYLGAIGQNKDLQIKIENRVESNPDLEKQITNNLIVFEEELLINEHKDLAQEILKKRHISNDDYINILRNTFPDAKLTLSEAYQIAYGNFYDEKMFHKRPLSKFTKDIALNTGSLKTKDEF
ncbi:MAG: hypothetical protein ACN6OJ_18865 [Chryseobacterium sp.]|uniref:hypothetical protein n=1 Tax=Chryseobacterium sp. TaxID=1871047 RepID=UPI003D129204